MKKLFKEIWKSLSKTKSLIIGLTILTFLSSGAFTLLNDVKTNYSTQFNEYKNVSKLHDLTVQTDLNATGEKPTKIYVLPESGKEKTEYVRDDSIVSSTVKTIRIPSKQLEVDNKTKETYIKISVLLGETITPENDYYIKTKDLYRFFQLNNIVNLIGEGNIVSPNSFPPTPFQMYKSPGVPIPRNYVLKQTDKIKELKTNVGQNITLGELINVVPGVDGWFSSTDDKITNIRTIYINASNHKASTSQTLRDSWEKQGILVTINGSDVAKLLGFKHDGNGIYSIDKSLSQKGVFDITLPTGKNKLRLNSSLSKKLIPGGFSLNLNKTIEVDIYKNDVNQYYTLEKIIKIQSKWIVHERTTLEYERYHTKINYDFTNPNAEQNKSWTLNYYEYISNISEELQKYYSQAVYWKKTQIVEIVEQDGTVLDPKETIRLSQKISSQDLNVTLREKTKINGPRSPSNKALKINSILDIELTSKFISQTIVDVILANINGDTSLALQTSLNNIDIKNEKIKQIDDGAKQIAQQNLYKKILELVGDKQNIGLRENLTVTGINDGMTNIYHFINGGNKNQEIKLNDQALIKQNVGKLYNETNEKSLLFQLSSEDNIKSKEVPISYIFKIVDIIFNGMSVDKNYINPIITFEDYDYIPYNNSVNTNSNISSKMKNAKIIRMMDAAGNIFGITKQQPRLSENSGKFYILKEQLKDNKKIWVSIPIISFDGTPESLQNFIINKGLNFANITFDNKKRIIVGENGWAKQNQNYSNKYSIPFKIMVPKAEIIDNWQESNNFNVFRDNLISSLTEIVSPLISPSNFKILVESLTTSFSKNGFSDVLSFPSQIENRKLQKMLFGIFYEAAQNSEKLYWNNFLDELLTKIIDNITNNSEYISEQIKVLDVILSQMFGQTFNINSILNYVKDIKQVFIGLRKIIASINIDETIIQIWNNFYDLERPKYQTIGTGDIIPIIIANISNEIDPSLNVGFKSGLKDIILQINFSKVINYIKNNLLDEESLLLFGPIIEQLNGNLVNKDPSKPFSSTSDDYLNINTGLTKIIDSVNLSILGQNIKTNSTMRKYYVDSGTNIPQEYIINSISVSGIFASLLSSMGNNNDGDKLLNEALIELLNLSSKTSNILGVYQPDSDPYKLDIRDLQSLLKSNTPTLDNVVSSLEELSILLENPNYIVNPDSVIGKYLTDYIFNFANDSSVQNKDIKKRVDIYLKFMKQTQFINFDPNMQIGSNPNLGGNLTNTGKADSLADKFINMINPNVRKANGGAMLQIIMNQVYSEFYNEKNLLQSRDMTVEILNFYSFWMKLTELNINNDESATIESTIQSINTLVDAVLDKNSAIGKILNSTTESFNPNILLDFKILDGFSNAKGTAKKLAAANPQNWLSMNALNYYFDYNNGTFTINNNTISLVTGLTSIIDINKPSKNDRSNLITNDFIKMFLSSDKETTNIMLTMGQRSLNTLSGPANSIMENIGLSSVVMNPFTGVLNAPTLLWFTVNQDANSLLSPGNLQFILKDRLYKFNSTDNQEGIDYEGFKGIIDSLTNEETFIDNPSNMDEKIIFSIDLDYLNHITENVLFDPKTGKYLDLFGIEISGVISDGINSFAEVKIDDFQIVISDIGSYITKVNDAYLKANKKEVFNFKKFNIEVPKTSIDMQQLVEKLHSDFKGKYTIDINGLKFLIIGTDSTVDYLYPVTNLNNIQVDTKTQALIYVNQFGFDRAKESNANSVVEKYFLLKSPKGMNSIMLRDDINEYIYKTITGLNNYNDLSNIQKENSLYKKAFLYNEANPLKPEISLRVKTIESLILIINNANLLISIILIILTGIVTIFVIKRYVSSRSKVLGILKAQGYKSTQIAISICLFALIVSIFGATLGYMAGHFLQIPFMNIFSIYWTLPIGPSSFSLVSLLVTVLVPLLGLILLTIVTTIFLLRIKPTKLMDGSFQLNNSKSAELIKSKFHSRNVKSKFTLALSLNSIGKLISLFVSLLLTVSIISFSIASNNAFGNVIDKTYKNRKYNFKIDLLTPTLEGGSITTLDSKNINNLLYVPIGNPSEGITYLADYFKPGPNSVINPSGDNYPNGNPQPFDKHIITKSSLDLIVKSGGIEVNVWNTLFNSMPDSQKSSAIEISQYAAKYLEWTQGLWIDENKNEYKPISDVDHNKAPYFKYIINNINPEKSKFVYRNIHNITGEYFYQDILIEGNSNSNIVSNNQESIRDKYRDFLVSAYEQALKTDNNINESSLYVNSTPLEEPELVQDYFLTFGSVVFNEDKNEKYSYASTISVNGAQTISPIINGYNKESKQVQILDFANQNLLEKASNRWEKSKSTVPIIINHVVKDKYNLNIGSQLELNLLNTTDRFINNLKDDLKNKITKKGITNISEEFTKSKTIRKFEVIGINETFINEEWTTSQEIVNEIISLDNSLLVSQMPFNEIPFNGILSTEDAPSQATGSLGLYSENGYWAADEKINLSNINLSSEQKQKNINIFKELFYKNNDGKNISVFAETLRILNPNFSTIEINELIKLFLGIELSLDDITSAPGHETIINKSLEIFSDLYKSNNILTPLFKDIKSKNIESGFISNTTQSINSISTMIIILSLLITITILVMISTLIISENERNAAIFSILGYNNKEKIILFFSLYLPIIILAILFSIPVTMGVISWFTAVTNSSILISLSISLNFVNVIISSAIVFSIFALTTVSAWISLNKIKPIILLKGE